MKTLSGVTFIFTLIFTLSCGINPDKSSLKFNDGTDSIKVDPIKVEDPAFANIQKKLFQVSCNNCHNPRKPKRLDLAKKENVIREYDDILYRMTDAFDAGVDNMPPEDGQVTKEVIEEFKAWKASFNNK